MKRTLLNMVQGILSKIDGDEVNHVSDTIESMQVATVFQDEFYNIVEGMDIESSGGLITLEDNATSDNPTLFRLPDNVSRIDWIKYGYLLNDADPLTLKYQDIRKMNLKEFVDYTDNRSPQDSTIQVVEYAGVQTQIRNDKQPQYWCSDDDEHIIFDSWNVALESTLNRSKLKIFGYTSPSFTISDDLIPDLPGNLFPYYYAKVEAYCMGTYKQQPNIESEENKRQLRVRAQRIKWRQGRLVHEDVNFGRK